jgi:hypothetical protein
MQSEEGEYLLKVAETAYQNGYYLKACETFLQARTANHNINHSENLPILVRKNLCQHGHVEQTAAALYLETALAGNANVYAYLLEIDNEIFMKPKESAVKLILEHWKK